MEKKLLQSIRGSATRGEAAAQFDLAQLLWNGDGVDENKQEALNLFRMAARQGHPQHQMKLGLILCWENYQEYGFLDGFEYVLKAAAGGLVAAQYFAGVEYATGANIAADLKAAARWYEMASAAGHSEARYNLGIMLLTGEGVERDEVKAKALIASAAIEGEISACRFLHEAYGAGNFGFEVDIEKSEFWGWKYDCVKIDYMKGG